MLRRCRLAPRYLPVVIAVGVTACIGVPDTQFGQNKVQYDAFDFEILETEHFDIFFYEEEREAAAQAGRMAERWYARLTRLLNHELRGRQPIIYYASHPHFKQTTQIGGSPGEGTGAVTEALKRRIILPFAGPLKETDHVLGHEMVHAFQFDMTQRQEGALSNTNFPRALRLPLWFIEGMAEYLSIGPDDPHTAMWIRDAAINDKLPTMRQLNNPRFFPYRFGQAFWAYLAGRFGDEVVGRILNAAARSGGAEIAIERVIGIPVDSVNAEWHEEVRRAYDDLREETHDADHYGKLLLSKENGAGLNNAPVLSPDGTELVFLSIRDVFSLDMFRADAETGKILNKLVESGTDPHFESIQFIRSAGAWNSTGDRFVFGAVTGSDPVLTVVDVSNGDIVREKVLPDLGEVFNPTWSPDGNVIVFSAIVGGFSDLYSYQFENDVLRRLTSDAYTDLHPAWSPDGRSIAFVTDRFGTNLSKLSYGNYQLALMDPGTGRIDAMVSFPKAKNINPQWSKDGRSLYFLADPTGITNVYRLDVGSGRLYQITDLFTGVSGITALSPALTSAKDTDKIAFSVYEKGDYNVYVVDEAGVLAGEPVASSQVGERGRGSR